MTFIDLLLANLLAYLLAFYLADLLAYVLAFYLAYLLAFYLAYLLGFYLAYLLATRSATAPLRLSLGVVVNPLAGGALVLGGGG